jgi:hypothetical protein
MDHAKTSAPTFCFHIYAHTLYSVKCLIQVQCQGVGGEQGASGRLAGCSPRRGGGGRGAAQLAHATIAAAGCGGVPFLRYRPGARWPFLLFPAADSDQYGRPSAVDDGHSSVSQF